MARWEPDARGRLLRAAVELFSESGYGAVTAAQIAERAGLTKTTLFRHFVDKRDILFQGQDVLVEVAASGVRSAPTAADPVEVLRAALSALCAVHDRDGRGLGRQLATILAASEELQERALSKRAVVGGALHAALAARLGTDRVAALLSDLGMRAYYEGFAAWIEADDESTLEERVSRELDDYVGPLAALAESLRDDAVARR